MESLLATLLVAAAVGYIAAAATALWLVHWSIRTRIVKFFFYIGSATMATGTGLALLLEPFGSFAGYTQMQWAIGFVIVQVVGMWAFVVNTVVESIEKAIDGRREGVASSVPPSENLKGEKMSTKMSTKATPLLIGLALGAVLAVGLFLALFMSGVFESEDLATWIPHHGSPAYNGADVGYLQDSENVPDSILSACNVERDGNFLRSRGKDRETGDFFRVTDYSADGTCEVNYTGRNLDRHEVREEGSDYTGFSYH